MDQTIIKKPEFRATTNDGTTIKVISKFLKNFHKRGPVGMIIRKKSIIFISNDKDLGMAYKINLDLTLFNSNISSFGKNPSYFYVNSDNFSMKTNEIRKRDTIIIFNKFVKGIQFLSITINKPDNKLSKLMSMSLRLSVAE